MFPTQGLTRCSVLELRVGSALLKEQSENEQGQILLGKMGILFSD